MGIFDWLLGKRSEKVREDEEKDEALLSVYTGMRVEVTEEDGRFLFVAKLMNLHRDMGDLYQYSETAVPVEEGAEPMAVRIRGYSDHERKAVYMTGVAHPEAERIWPVTKLVVEKIENARAFYRLDTDLPATMTMFSGILAGEKPCRMLNISIGGARLFSENEYHEKDRFMLKVKLLEERPQSVMYCEVLRTFKREEGWEYGCQFLELTEEDQEKISQNIFDAQRKKRM